MVVCRDPSWYCHSSAVAPVVSVDWMAFSCLLSDEWEHVPWDVPMGWSVERCSPTAVWSERHIVRDADGNKVCTLLAVPRSGLLDCRRAVVEVANRWLYYDDWREIFDKSLSIKGLAVTGINRVDLAGDFEMTASRWETYSCLASGCAYLKGVRAGTKWWRVLDGMRMAHQMSWGGKESVFKWKVYYKWLELEEAGPDARKEYIRDTWRVCGMRERFVWRCEVSITDAHRLVVGADGGRLGVYEWMEKRAEVWRGLVNQKFVVRMDDGHADRRHDRVLPFLDVDDGVRLFHGLPAGSRDDSDPERRVAVKLWSELMAGDVEANRSLRDVLAGALWGLLERPAVVDALCRAYSLTPTEIRDALCDAK